MILIFVSVKLSVFKIYNVLLFFLLLLYLCDYIRFNFTLLHPSNRGHSTRDAIRGCLYRISKWFFVGNFGFFNPKFIRPSLRHLSIWLEYSDLMVNDGDITSVCTLPIVIVGLMIFTSFILIFHLYFYENVVNYFLIYNFQCSCICFAMFLSVDPSIFADL